MDEWSFADAAEQLRIASQSIVKKLATMKKDQPSYQVDELKPDLFTLLRR